ncbi:SET domain-containing protein 5 [Diaporthe eres]|uniref:SET domain-containing protein 5 n=1 Tax=Diaporthe eres TaxID=83184 RepID=A0ABR1PC52_DIAER
MNVNIGTMLEARPAGDGMGKGLFATVDISVGTRILLENPIILLPQSPTPFREFCQAARSMDSDMNGLRDLHCNALLLNEHLPGNILAQIRSEDPQNTIDFRDDSLMDLIRLYATYYTNAVTIIEDGEDVGSAVFRTFSNVNHSCKPNVFSIFSTKTNRQTVYAGWNIKAGEQILISYFGGNEDFMTCERRLEQTRRDWGFTCACEACLESRITDPERERMGLLKKRLDQSIKNWPPDDHSARQTLALEILQEAKELLQLMEEVGVGYWKFRQIYQDCSRYNMFLGYQAEAVRYAKQYREIEEVYYSEDGIDLAWMDQIGLRIPE